MKFLQPEFYGQSPPPEFGRSANPIQTKGADYAPHTDIINFFKHNAGHAKLY